MIPLRKLIVTSLALFALNGCSMTTGEGCAKRCKPGTIELGLCTETCVQPKAEPLVSPEPSKPLQIRTGYERLMTVEKLYAWCEYGKLNIQVTGLARSGGWHDADLNPMGSENITPVYEIVATPPAGEGGNTLQPMTVKYSEPMWPGVGRVTVRAQSNELTAGIFIGKNCDPLHPDPCSGDPSLPSCAQRR